MARSLDTYTVELEVNDPRRIIPVYMKHLWTGPAYTAADAVRAAGCCPGSVARKRVDYHPHNGRPFG